MPQLDTILIKTASRCNLDCTYCYVYHGTDTSWQNQPKKLSDSTIESIIHKLHEFSTFQSKGFAIVLHGGEPLLLGMKKLEKLLTGLRQSLKPEKYPIGIQTNGILISGEFLDLCSSCDVSVSVSIDGVKETNDISRIYRNRKSSFDKTMQGIVKLREHRNSEFLFSGTITVIQPTSDPIETYRFLKSTGSPRLSFLLQDGNHESLPTGKQSFHSTEYGNWLVKLLDHYIDDPNPVKIRLFDDYLKLFLGGKTMKEGKGRSTFGILIIETDGEIRKNDTLRSSYDGVDKFVHQPNINTTSIQSIVDSEEFKSNVELQIPESKTCRECKLLKICGGGMPLYRWSKENEFCNPSVYCEDHKVLLWRMSSILGEKGIPTWHN